MTGGWEDPGGNGKAGEAGGGGAAALAGSRQARPSGAPCSTPLLQTNPF